MDEDTDRLEGTPGIEVLTAEDLADDTPGDEQSDDAEGGEVDEGQARPEHVESKGPPGPEVRDVDPEVIQPLRPSGAK